VWGDRLSLPRIYKLDIPEREDERSVSLGGFLDCAHAAFARQDDLIAGLTYSQDAREGATAFAEKRKPVWQGR